MRRLTRLPEPDILRTRKTQWLERFEASGKKHPSASQYGHPEIRSTLQAMSFHKCFYCETKVGATGQNEEVDHYIEVAEDRSRAFDWENLYLSCQGCNRSKRPNTQIPVQECLDPCGAEDPSDHLTFEDELITTKDSSPLGLKTIQKHALDRGDLNHLRLKALQRFHKALITLHKRRGNRAMTDAEKSILRRYAQPDHPFSLMFQTLLDDTDL